MELVHRVCSASDIVVVSLEYNDAGDKDALCSVLPFGKLTDQFWVIA